MTKITTNCNDYKHPSKQHILYNIWSFNWLIISFPILQPCYKYYCTLSHSYIVLVLINKFNHSKSYSYRNRIARLTIIFILRPMELNSNTPLVRSKMVDVKLQYFFDIFYDKLRKIPSLTFHSYIYHCTHNSKTFIICIIFWFVETPRKFIIIIE